MCDCVTDADLDTLRAMDPVDGRAVVKEILRLWNRDYGRATWRGGWLTLVTGGWSDNEAILGSLPLLFNALYAESWKRGGLYVYRIPKRKEGIGR